MSSNDTDSPQFNTSTFKQESFAKRINKPWGYEIHWVPAELPYMGKVLHINEGARLSLQIHDQKQESWFLIKGKAKVIWEDNNGKLTETVLSEGVGYSTSVGQKHRLVGISDCDIIEVSTPELGTTWRLEDDYSRPDETEAQRAIERT
ncbi:MAG: mannose-6-phosphate isomerase [Patescibacteria group bacterium]|nr:mannose-6-phosphate isomerase [Patescibacteria group bacterium]